MLALDTPDNLTLRLRDASEIVAHIDGPQAEVATLLHSLPGVHEVQATSQESGGPTTYTVRAAQHEDVRPSIVEAVSGRGWRLFELHAREMDLEEIFHRVVDQPQS